jgi:hypothetical protein
VIIRVASRVIAGLTGQLDLVPDLGARSGWAAAKVLTGHDSSLIQLGKCRFEKIAVRDVPSLELSLKMLCKSFLGHALRVRTEQVGVMLIGKDLNGP